MGGRTRLFLMSFPLLGVLGGCTGHQDTRLTDDEKTCASMGHTPGSDMFKQCLVELNERRCGVVKKGRFSPNEHHPTEACTQLSP